jgi:hypothetical protein
MSIPLGEVNYDLRPDGWLAANADLRGRGKTSMMDPRNDDA